jgi:hypothetical protein
MAVLLAQHPGWTPGDLERADPDVIELVRLIHTATARVANQKRED